VHRLAAAARSDLDHIWDYSFEGSGRTELADQMVDSITLRFHLLTAYPAMGRVRDDELGEGTRSFPIGDYVIVYRIVGNDVLILRVAHGRRDLKALMEP
jgi:toxin ParE1/3/4